MSDSSTSRRAAATATLCLAVAASGSVHAQREMSQYLRDEWTSDRGFPGGPVHAVTQTADGYLWIGAEKGLVRFDGLTFRLIEPKRHAPNAAPAVLGVVAFTRWIGMGASARHRAPSLSARCIREHPAGPGSARIGRHGDGARARRLDPHVDTRPSARMISATGVSTSSRTRARSRARRSSSPWRRRQPASSGSARAAPASFTSRARASRDSRTGCRT